MTFSNPATKVEKKVQTVKQRNEIVGWGQTNAFLAGDVTFPSTTLPRTQLIQLTWGRYKIMLEAQTQAKSMSLIKHSGQFTSLNLSTVLITTLCTITVYLLNLSFLVNCFSQGCGCCTEVEHTPRNLEVVVLNPARLGPFILLPSFPTFLHQWSGLNQLPQESASLSVCCESNKKAQQVQIS